jgi:hypothetical protein
MLIDNRQIELEERMKRIIVILGACICLTSLTVNAQDLKSSYFMKSDNLRHDLNPAFMGESGYVSFPLLGSFNVNTQGNVGLNDFLYKTKDASLSKYKLTTFMSPTVSRDDFMSKIKQKNRISANAGISLFSFGTTTKHGYNTFELNLKSSTQAILPYELFDFMKTGMGKGSYDLKNLSARSRSYMELAIGHARHINKKLDIGVKLKVLVGAANADAKFDSLQVTLTGNEWQVHSKGSLNVSLAGSSFEKDEDENFVNGIKVNKAGIAGWGGAIDIGATYKVMDGFTVSGALLDLGMITWTKNRKASSNETFTFDGFKDIAIDSDNDYDENAISKQWTGIRDDMKKLTHFYEDKNAAKSRTEMLSTTLNMGAEYVLPYYHKLSFGLLSSTRFAGKYTSTTVMLSANVRPINLIEASLNCNCSTYGTSIGGMLSIHPKFFTFFIGSDCIVTKVTPQYVPITSANCNICVGLNFSVF